MYTLAARVAGFVLRLFGRAKIYHKDKLPSAGGYVVACTHKGWVDILWLGVALFPVKIHYMAKKELFRSAFVGWLMQKLNAFPVDRENPGPSSLKIPHQLLKKGENIGIFPSGTRTSEEVPLKRGAVTIASRSKAPIVPVAYAGPANFKELLKRKKAKIIFGDPILAPADLSKKEAIEYMAVDLDEALKTLQAKIE